jgi:hypothetical protein
MAGITSLPGCVCATICNAQRARITTEAGPALYLAKLFGSNDTEAVVRLITALLVLDPLAVLLTLAAARDNWGVLG